MGGVTRLRGRQTKASDKFDPSGDSLTTDLELSKEILTHTKLYHNNRDSFVELIYLGNDISEKKTFLTNNKNVLLEHIVYEYVSSKLDKFTKTVYLEDGSAIFKKIEKTFTYSGNKLESISTIKLI